MPQERKLEILTALFITSLVSATLLGGKMTSVFGVAMSVGIFISPLTFFIVNIIEESIGRGSAKKFIKLGLISLIVVFIFTWLATFLKPSERYFFDQAYDLIFSNSFRLIIASLLTFWLSLKFNLWVFHFFRKKIQLYTSKYSWLCAPHNLGIISTQLVETLIFVFIAYYGRDASSDLWPLVKIIFPYWLIKSLFTTIATPIYFYGVRWLKKNTTA